MESGASTLESGSLDAKVPVCYRHLNTQGEVVYMSHICTVCNCYTALVTVGQKFWSQAITSARQSIQIAETSFALCSVLISIDHLSGKELNTRPYQLCQPSTGFQR